MANQFILAILALSFLPAVNYPPEQHRGRQLDRNRLPQFEDYRIGKLQTKHGELIRIDKPRFDESTTQFAKRIRRAGKKGPNFAGHYAVVGWSCGMICINIAIVNIKTSKIHNTPFMGIGDGPCPAGFYDEERRLVDFRLDSRLLILRGTPEDFGPAGAVVDSPCSTRFYSWKGERLILVREMRASN